ncbi:MAG: AAA family ATPase [Planctomycetota bacterium]|nr:AAA family ATPase [Planctomycetota bacterium]
MATGPDSSLLERLAQSGAEGDAEAWDAVAASTPNEPPAKSTNAGTDPKFSALLAKIGTIKKSDVGAASTKTSSAVAEESFGDGFVPLEPKSYVAAGLSESDVEALIFKLLLGRGDTAGRTIADHIRLPFVLVDETLQRLKNEQLLVYRGSAPMNDYIYQLPDIGRERARRLAEHCSYFGAAPVALADYQASVKAQSLSTQHPTVEDLKQAFSDLLINQRMLERLGPAVNSGRGLFLFGAPGNGKTSIAERVTKAFGETIWLPRAIGIDGEILRLFDPTCHEEMPIDNGTGLLSQSRVDKRWVRIKRPTIVVGGELTMEALEVVFNKSTGISEAPLQLKSNCGTLVIDDFGRQRMTTDELLNRWIVPLEKRYDYLNLANGKKIQVPFDQLIIFSTNLEPKELVDEAFLRRIPYKIEVVDPNEHEFRELFKIMCPKMGFEYNEAAIDHLLMHHYLEVERPFRNCQPRDLLMQVRNHCFYQGKELVLTPEAFDFAAENYFSVL